MRIVTWNVRHGEFGLERVADALVSLAPDVVLLQELDRGCRRSGGVDQPHILAQALGLVPHFEAAFPFDGGEYGLAILTPAPLDRLRVVRLPHETPRRPDGHGEPRIVLSGELGGLTIACTHLGLSDPERVGQAKAIQAAYRDTRRLVLGGDLNEDGKGGVYDAWREWLVDAFAEAGGHERPTAPDDRPIGRIDHILRTSDASRPVNAWIPEIRASDHLAVVVELEGTVR